MGTGRAHGGEARDQPEDRLQLDEDQRRAQAVARVVAEAEMGDGRAGDLESFGSMV
jgi:hypothetical protein